MYLLLLIDKAVLEEREELRVQSPSFIEYVNLEIKNITVFNI